MSSDRPRPIDLILTSETQFVPRGALGTKFHVKKGFPRPELNLANDTLAHFVSNGFLKLSHRRIVHICNSCMHGFRGYRSRMLLSASVTCKHLCKYRNLETKLSALSCNRNHSQSYYITRFRHLQRCLHATGH